MGRPKKVIHHQLSWKPIKSETKKGMQIQSWFCQEFPGLVLTWIAKKEDLKRFNQKEWPFNGFDKHIKELEKMYEKAIDRKSTKRIKL